MSQNPSLISIPNLNDDCLPNNQRVRNLLVQDNFVGDQFVLTWEYDQYFNPNFVEFIIKRAPNKASPFVELARTTFLEYIDIKANRSTGFSWYYTITPAITAYTTVESTPVAWSANTKLWQNHNILKARVQDLVWIIDKGGFGEKCILLKKKYAGPLCIGDGLKPVTTRRGFISSGTNASQPDLSQDASGFFGYKKDIQTFEENVGRDDYTEHEPEQCPYCFGTNRQGGFERYHSVFNVSRTNPTVENLMARQEGRVKTHLQEWWTLSHPSLIDGDILIRGSNFRFQLSDVTRADPINGLVLWQTFNLIEIQPTDIKYRILSGLPV